MIGGRTKPHVHEERFETVPPTVTDRNPPTAVIGKAVGFGVVTATFHALPRSVFGRLAHAVSLRELFSETPATLGFAKNQAAGSHLGGIAAFAHARPENTAAPSTFRS